MAKHETSIEILNITKKRKVCVLNKEPYFDIAVFMDRKSDTFIQNKDQTGPRYIYTFTYHIFAIRMSLYMSYSLRSEVCSFISQLAHFHK